jgi:hypothetical protein
VYERFGIDLFGFGGFVRSAFGKAYFVGLFGVGVGYESDKRTAADKQYVRSIEKYGVMKKTRG